MCSSDRSAATVSAENHCPSRGDKILRYVLGSMFVLFAAASSLMHLLYKGDTVFSEGWNLICALYFPISLVFVTTAIRLFQNKTGALRAAFYCCLFSFAACEHLLVLSFVLLIITLTLFIVILVMAVVLYVFIYLLFSPVAELLGQKMTDPGNVFSTVSFPELADVFTFSLAQLALILLLLLLVLVLRKLHQRRNMQPALHEKGDGLIFRLLPVFVLLPPVYCCEFFQHTASYLIVDSYLRFPSACVLFACLALGLCMGQHRSRLPWFLGGLAAIFCILCGCFLPSMLRLAGPDLTLPVIWQVVNTLLYLAAFGFWIIAAVGSETSKKQNLFLSLICLHSVYLLSQVAELTQITLPAFSTITPLFLIFALLFLRKKNRKQA